MKMQPKKWDTAFMNYTSDNGLMSEIHKKHIQLNNTKTNNILKKWAEEPNRHFSKEDINTQQIHEKYHIIMLYNLTIECYMSIIPQKNWKQKLKRNTVKNNQFKHYVAIRIISMQTFQLDSK